MTTPLENTKPKSLEEALFEWNKAQRWSKGQSRLKPNPERVDAIGKTVQVCYTVQKGYWLEQASCVQPLLNFLEKLNLCDSNSNLNEAQQKELKELLQIYSVASRSLSESSTPEEVFRVKIAMVRVFYGPEYAHAYSLIMNPEPDEKEIQQLFPTLERILEEGSKRDSLINHEDLNFIQHTQFIQAAQKHLGIFYAKLQKGYYLRQLEKNMTAEEMKMIIQAANIRGVYKLFYAKLLDSCTLKPHLRALEGLPPNIAVSSFLKDLQEFQKKGSFDADQTIRLDQAIAGLQFANEMRNLSKVENKEAREKVPEEFHNKLQQLARLDFAIPFVLLGGSTDHAVLYLVERAKDGTLQFTILNTGAGANVITELSSTRSGKKKTKDVQYTGLEPSNLSPEFFEGLIRLGKESPSMKEILAFIDHSLLQHKGVKKGEGLTRNKQSKRTCSVRCVREWLRQILGKPLFQQFDVEMAERSLRSVTDVSKDITPLTQRILFPVPFGVEESEEKFYAEQIQFLTELGQASVQRKKNRIKPLALPSSES